MLQTFLENYQTHFVISIWLRSVSFHWIGRGSLSLVQHPLVRPFQWLLHSSPAAVLGCSQSPALCSRAVTLLWTQNWGRALWSTSLLTTAHTKHTCKKSSLSPWIGLNSALSSDRKWINLSLSISYLTLCQFHCSIPTLAALIEINSQGTLKAYSHCQEN